MRGIRTSWPTSLLLLLWAGCGAGSPIVDLRGRVQDPLGRGGRGLTLLVFILQDCPIANSYAPEINRIRKEYASRGVVTYVVHADPDLTAEEARRHASEYGYENPVLLDPGQTLVSWTGVGRAPEAVLVSRGEDILYRGRIDDLFADYGKKRPEPTSRDLRDALEAALVGRPIRFPDADPVGCFIPRASGRKNHGGSF